MTYYCFLCNNDHEGIPTREHFIPQSMGAPKRQWLPVCKASNARSNYIFDNDSKDILYHTSRLSLRRMGEALLRDGSTKKFKFSYLETPSSNSGARFDYFFDKSRHKKVPTEDVVAILFPIGLSQEEKVQLCRGLSKISIGALVYLLKEQNVENDVIKEMLSQVSISALRNYALNYPLEDSTGLKFLIGRTDILERLQSLCKDPKKRNHVIKISFKEDNSLHIEGMLHSQYGWVLDCPNKIVIKNSIPQLENSLDDKKAPETLKDLTSTLDRICIINPNYIGIKPKIPSHWKNNY